MTQTSIATRTRIARQKAASLGLKVRKDGNIYSLRDGASAIITGGLGTIEAYLQTHYKPKRPGPARAQIPASWRQLIADYLDYLEAGGQSAGTVRVRSLHLAHLARGLGQPPDKITADMLVKWFGQQRHWSNATRRLYRSSARKFFAWAYQNRRLADHLGDCLPAVRDTPPLPLPVPDQVWRDALIAADPRLKLMLRLAGEAGLRRAEVARVHTKDLIEGAGGPQLLVYGKGNKRRVIPISNSLAELIRLGPGGHTPGHGPHGWLFPAWPSGHLSAAHVGTLVGRVLPHGWSMHKLRHRYASRAFRGSRNIRAVQTLLGHSSVATTERYTAVDSDEVRSAAMAAILDDEGDD